MISNEVFICPVCKEERYQRVVFLGGEFSYQCPVCMSLHVFYENLFPKFQDNFNNNCKWSRYVGTYSTELKNFINVPHHEILPHFRLLCELFYEEPIEANIVKRVVLSEKEDNGKYFIGSCFHDHFQEAFRGFYHLKGNVSSKSETYNILILPAESFEFLLEETSKLDGIDQVWVVSLKKKYRWPYVNNREDAKQARSSDLAITTCLDQLNGMGLVVTKRAGPVPNGKELLKFLLEPEKETILLDNKNAPLDGKYLALLIHSDDSKRAGLNTPEQFNQIKTILPDKKILLVVTSEYEFVKAKKIGLPYIYVNKITDQTQFYRDHCVGVIGSNSSGCNIPALYNLPIFAFVKTRGFPDDFYCFARMASEYNKESIPWNGELEKADNIVEIVVDKQKQTSPSEFEDQLLAWYQEYIYGPLKKFSTEGIDELEHGFKDKCPSCGKMNRSREVQLVGSDFYVKYQCDCEVEYICLRGLTSLSRRGVHILGSEGASLYQEVLQLKEKRELSPAAEMMKEGINYSYNPNKKDVIFYCMKASISDLFYCLPSLYYLDMYFRDKYNIIAVVPKVYSALVPSIYVDYLVPIAINLVDYKKESFSFLQYSLQKMISDANGRVTSNIPGTLPYSENLYRYFSRLIFSLKQEKTNDVVIFCRLKKDSRTWPLEENIKELVRVFEASSLSYRFLVFPESDKEQLPSVYFDTKNVVLNPTLMEQLNLVSTSRVCLTPHGASEVIACIADVPIIELETEPNWWSDKTPQPLRYGLSKRKFIKLQDKEINKISCESVVEGVRSFVNG